MGSWVHHKEEETYLVQLERMLVQRLQNRTDEQESALNRSIKSEQVGLNKLSVEINEELDRLESMIEEEQSN